MVTQLAFDEGVMENNLVVRYADEELSIFPPHLLLADGHQKVAFTRINDRMREPDGFEGLQGRRALLVGQEMITESNPPGIQTEKIRESFYSF